jgi:hypothetical protein
VGAAVIRRFNLVACAAVLVALCAAPAAQAADKIAPPGSPPHWLPKWDWVLDHWFPYDTQRLYTALHTSDPELRKYFGGQEHQVVPPLLGLAHERGWTRAKLVRHLVRPWRGHVTRRQYRRLAHRASLTLTQGHLMQHMLFHPLHEKALFDRGEEIYGAPNQEVLPYRKQGLSPLEIAAHFGRSKEQATDAVETILRETAAEGIQRKLTPRAQMLRYLAIQLPLVPGWLEFKGTGMNPQAMYEHGGHQHAGAAAAGGGGSGKGSLESAARAGSSAPADAPSPLIPGLIGAACALGLVGIVLLVVRPGRRVSAREGRDRAAW